MAGMENNNICIGQHYKKKGKIPFEQEDASTQRNSLLPTVWK